MANKTEYIGRLQMVIYDLHGCDSTWVRSVLVHERFNGETVWNGEVEVFNVSHQRAKNCYAWATAKDQFTAVLGIPPATDPCSAVKVSMVVNANQLQV